jgi:hypothetical protein
VSFYTPVPGSSYQIRVAGAVRDIAAALVAGSGTIAVGGYHTVPLATPLAVTAGEEFVVAIKLTTPGYGRPIPVERPSDLIAPRAAPRQSYISHGGATWTDVVTKPGFDTSSVCLKAFVDSDGAGDTTAPKAVVGAARARSGGLARVPAVAYAELGVWRFGCTMGAGTYYVYARAHDVVGNRQTVPTRAVFKVL